MADKQQFDSFIHYVSRSLFASAWAKQQEENGYSLGDEIMDQIPDVIDPAATHAAVTLALDIERINSKSIAKMMEDIESIGNGDRPETIEYFGHCAAMQAFSHILPYIESIKSLPAPSTSFYPGLHHKH